MLKAAKFLKDNDGFLILTHRRPDGDTCGSAAALCLTLRAMGKKAYICKNEDLTDRLLPFVADLFPPKSFKPCKIVAVDVADEGLLPDSAKKYAGKVDLCIDHHPTNKKYAALTWVDKDEAAVGVMIFALAKKLGVTPDVKIAEAVYLAVATDTGCFKYANTTVKAHRVAAECIRLGADFHGINTKFFVIKTRARMELEKEMFDKMIFSKDKRICATVLSRAFIEKVGADNDDLDNLSSLTMQIDTLLCGILLTENTARGTFKVSVRSRTPVSASRICAAFGGGGHDRAAGATLEGDPSECVRMLMSEAERELSHV